MPPPPYTVEEMIQAYVEGFAAGIEGILHGAVPKLCTRHAAEREEALAARGIRVRVGSGAPP
jgi:hypothetical protein